MMRYTTNPSDCNFKCQLCPGVFHPRHTADTSTWQVCPGVLYPRDTAARHLTEHRSSLPALLGVCPKKCGYTSSWNDKGRERLVASRPVTTRLVDPHAAGRNPAARSRIDARRYRGVRPDELRAGRSIASRDHIKTKKNKSKRAVLITWTEARTS
jgi:hypothetical protein